MSQGIVHVLLHRFWSIYLFFVLWSGGSLQRGSYKSLYLAKMQKGTHSFWLGYIQDTIAPNKSHQLSPVQEAFGPISLYIG